MENDPGEARGARQWIIGFGAAFALTAAMLLLRHRLDKAHIALLYLLPVLGGAAQGGRRLGMALALFTFVCFNFLFLSPYYTLHVYDPRDWLVLAIYIITASGAAHLFYRARSAAARLQQLADSERALREADELKNALLATVSHDLRTPLTAIKALAHDLVEEGHARAGDIEVHADRLNRLVGDLLDLSRLTAAGMPLHAEINAAEDVIGAVMDQMTPALDRREVRITIDTEAPLLLGRFDFVHTLRILANLIENSHKYSPEDAPIDISVVQDGVWLRFLVEDRGTGIAEVDGERIYEPFYRTAGSLGPGTGLGLSIARQLAELQGGDLSHARRAGGGTSFSLRLPSTHAPT